jgi:hypothetical protein
MIIDLRSKKQTNMMEDYRIPTYIARMSLLEECKKRGSLLSRDM